MRDLVVGYLAFFDGGLLPLRRAHGFPLLPSFLPETASQVNDLIGAGLALQRAKATQRRKENDKSLVAAPPRDKQRLPAHQHAALVLLPGCLLQPQQYEDVVKAIQKSSHQAVWVSVPKLPMDMANPWSTPVAVRQSLQSLQAAGYPGRTAFVGGHSLGGVFLQNSYGRNGGLDKDQVKGLIHLGSFRLRSDSQENDKDDDDGLKRLTLTGDLDGMVRTARIAEDFYRHVIRKGDSGRRRLNHAVVLVRGMVSMFVGRLFRDESSSL